jgi:hypothetical protein
MCLTKVGADVDARVAVIEEFSLSKVLHFLEAVDATFCATCSFYAMFSAIGLIFLT